MPYGISDRAISLISRWDEAKYVLHMMTGVAWGEYQDFLDGKFDERDHWDDAQVDPQGKQILHGPRVPEHGDYALRYPVCGLTGGGLNNTLAEPAPRNSVT
jgi:hypothetical protein